MNPASEPAHLVGAVTRRSTRTQLLKFGVVGGSGYLVNLAVFALLAGALGMQYVLASVLAFGVAVSNNFFWNRHWTFAPGDAHPAFQAARFLTVSIAALLINVAVLQAMVVGASVDELAAQAIAVAVAMPFNFLGNKLWTFADLRRKPR